MGDYSRPSKSILSQILKWLSSVPIMILVAIVLAPQSFPQVDYRGYQAKIHIGIPKNSPVFAAVEDAQNQYTPAHEEVETLSISDRKEKVLLLAGQYLVTDKLLQMILPQQAAEPKQWVPLKGLVISQTLPHQHHLRGIRIAAETPKGSKGHSHRIASVDTQDILPQDILPSETRVEPSLLDSRGQLAPLDVRKKRLADHYADHIQAPKSIEERTRELVEQELSANEAESLHADSPLGSGSTVVVKPGALPKNNPAPRGSQTPKKSMLPAVPAAASEPIAQVGALNAQPVENFVLSGQLAFQEGLAYVDGQHQLYVAHVHQGDVVSEAKVWMDTGRFEIFVSELKGHLVAELVSPDGELLGEGEVDLYRLPQLPYAGMRVQSLLLEMYPLSSPSTVQVEMMSARSFDQHRILVPGARVFIDAIDSELSHTKKTEFLAESISTRSSFLYRGEATNHWGSIAVGFGGRVSQAQMLPNKMVEALVSLLGLDEEEVARNGIIWGRVLSDGKPLAGAQVEVAGDSGGRPIYFNGWLPDHRLEQTGSNGVFVILNVVPGVQAVRATYQGKALPLEVMPTHPSTVSYAEFHLALPQVATVSVVDASHPHEKLEAILNVVGTEEYFNVGPGGHEAVEFPGGKGLMFVDVDAGASYEVLRTSVNRKSRHFEFPMVPSEWLNSVKANQKVNINPDTGVVIGFHQESAFEVHLENGLDAPDLKILYFDEEGRVLSSDSGVPGGGFVAFNVPLGFRTLTMVPKSGQLETQVTVVEQGYTNIVF